MKKNSNCLNGGTNQVIGRLFVQFQNHWVLSV